MGKEGGGLGFFVAWRRDLEVEGGERERFLWLEEDIAVWFAGWVELGFGLGMRFGGGFDGEGDDG